MNSGTQAIDGIVAQRLDASGRAGAEQVGIARGRAERRCRERRRARSRGRHARAWCRYGRAARRPGRATDSVWTMRLGGGRRRALRQARRARRVPSRPPATAAGSGPAQRPRATTPACGRGGAARRRSAPAATAVSTCPVSRGLGARSAWRAVDVLDRSVRRPSPATSTSGLDDAALLQRVAGRRIVSLCSSPMRPCVRSVRSSWLGDDLLGQLGGLDQGGAQLVRILDRRIARARS